MSNGQTRITVVWLLLVVLLAFCLRLYAIDRQDIWGDEAVSIQLSRGPLPQVLAEGAETVPPLYHLFLASWLRLGGVSPLAVRFLSAAFGTLAVAVVYLLGYRVAGSLVGMMGAMLAAVSPSLVYYSQEARVYSVLVFFTAACVYWTMRAISNPRRLGVWIAYLITALAAAYTHYYAFFVILAVNLVAVVHLIAHRRWPALSRWIATQVVLILAYIPWIVVQTSFITGKASGRFEEWTLSIAATIAGQTLSALSAGLSVSPGAARLIVILFLPPLITALFQRSKEPIGRTLLIAYLLVPLLFAWLVNPLMPFFFPRYLLLVAPAFYVLAAWGVAAWGKAWRPLTAVGMLILLLGSAYGLRGYYFDDAYLKGRYGQMMAYVQQNSRVGDGLILANGLQRPLFEYYQPDGLDHSFFPQPDYPISDPRTAEDLTEISASHGRLWLVRFGNPAEYDPDGTIHRWLSAYGSKAYSGGWVDSELSLYVMNSAGADGIQYPMAADLGGEIRLVGYSLDADRVSPGDTLLLTLFWQAQAPVSERYTVFTHLLDYGGEIRAQMDGEPQGGGLPTDRWMVGEVVEDNYALEVAADTPPGSHALEVGMYLWSTGDRLPILDPGGSPLGDRVLLGTVEVVAP